jgi:hypothetical protein
MAVGCMCACGFTQVSGNKGTVLVLNLSLHEECCMCKLSLMLDPQHAPYLRLWEDRQCVDLVQVRLVVALRGNKVDACRGMPYTCAAVLHRGAILLLSPIARPSSTGDQSVHTAQPM